MATKSKEITLLVADDDADDKLLLKYALDENKVLNPVQFVDNGEKLLEVLQKHEEKYGECLHAIILLDLNMPRMDGREALKRIKAHHVWCKIPVVVFSTSASEIDINSSYHLGASSYVTKPSGFENLVAFVRDFKSYWFQNVLFAK